jgi:transcriptional regulator with XRE-family HTH domain
MAFQYSERAVRAAMKRASLSHPTYNEVGKIIEQQTASGKRRLKRILQLSNNAPLPDIPWSFTAPTPTNLEEIATYRTRALNEYIRRLRRLVYPEAEIAQKLSPFAKLDNELATRTADELAKRNLPDVLPVTPQSDVTYVLDLFPEVSSARELLNAWRVDLGITFQEMGEKINPDSALSIATVQSLLNRKGNKLGFRTYQQFLKGLGIPTRSLFTAAFAMRLAQDFHESENPHANPSLYPVDSFENALKFYDKLPQKPKSLGQYLKFLREKINATKRKPLAKYLLIGNSTILEAEQDRHLPNTDTLFRYLEGLEYYPGSKESILAVMLALEAADKETKSPA